MISITKDSWWCCRVFLFFFTVRIAWQACGYLNLTNPKLIWTTFLKKRFCEVAEAWLYNSSPRIDSLSPYKHSQLWAGLGAGQRWKIPQCSKCKPMIFRRWRQNRTKHKQNIVFFCRWERQNSDEYQYQSIGEHLCSRTGKRSSHQWLNIWSYKSDTTCAPSMWNWEWVLQKCRRA